MIVIDNESVTLTTPSGPMRTHIVRPALSLGTFS
jgi:hypothetical protein